MYFLIEMWQEKPIVLYEYGTVEDNDEKSSGLLTTRITLMADKLIIPLVEWVLKICITKLIKKLIAYL